MNLSLIHILFEAAAFLVLARIFHSSFNCDTTPDEKTESNAMQSKGGTL